MNSIIDVFNELKKTYEVEWIDNNNNSFNLYFKSNDKQKDVKLYVDRNYNDCYIKKKNIFGKYVWKGIKGCGHNHTDDVDIQDLYAEIISTIIYTKNVVNYNYIDTDSKKLSIENTTSLDGVGVNSNDNSKLVLLLIDGMDWTNELEHLLLLQNKINNYISYIEEEQYKESYPNIENIEININFLFEIPNNCMKLLDVIKNTIYESLDNVTLKIECENEKGDYDYDKKNNGTN